MGIDGRAQDTLGFAYTNNNQTGTNMIEAIQMYKVGDKVFANKADATAYANREQYSARVDRFIASREWKQGKDTMARNHILSFLSFEDTNEDTEDFAE